MDAHQDAASPPVAVLGDVRLRPMRREDIAAVMAVERAAYAFPWSEQIMSDCLRVGCMAWVAESSQGLHAYGLLSLAVDECHLLNIAVHPRARRRGLARRLIRHLLSLAADDFAQRCILEVRPSNVAALQLYQCLGFERIGLRKGYYPGAQGREDAMVLAKEPLR